METLLAKSEEHLKKSQVYKKLYYNFSISNALVGSLVYLTEDHITWTLLVHAGVIDGSRKYLQPGDTLNDVVDPYTYYTAPTHITVAADNEIRNLLLQLEVTLVEPIPFIQPS